MIFSMMLDIIFGIVNHIVLIDTLGKNCYWLVENSLFKNCYDKLVCEPIQSQCENPEMNSPYTINSIDRRNLGFN